MSLVDQFYQIAKDRVWANQHADRHAVFETKLVSPFTGVKYHLVTSVYTTHMPDYPERVNPNTYIILEVGGVDRETIGIDANVNLSQWISIDTLISTCKLFGMVFSNYRLFNLSQCFIRMSSNGVILLAIERSIHVNRLYGNYPIYLRLYSNSDTTQLGYAGNYLFESELVTTSINYSNFKNIYESLDNGFAFLNGYFMPNGFPLFTNLLNQSSNEVQYVIDPEIINYITIDKEDFINFTYQSEIFYIASSPEDTDSMYFDDIEFFVSGNYTHPVTQVQTRFGLYLPRLSELHINQLTFKDWVFKKTHWDTIESTLRTLLGSTLSAFQLHLIVRQSGNNLFYVQDSSRITDIMNLPVSVRQQVFTTNDPICDFWRAENLMNSSFNQWLGLKENELTINGFHNVFSSYGAIEIAERVRYNHYDEVYTLPFITHDKGWLIRFIDGLRDTSNDDYYASGATAELPYLSGLGSELWLPDIDYTNDLDIVVPVGEAVTTLTTSGGFGIFCYSTENNELLMSIYETDYTYTDISPTQTEITWEAHMVNKPRFVRLGNRFINYQKVVNTSDITDGFNIYNGRAMIHDVGMQKAMVWYKGRYLIEGLDYFINNSIIHLVGKWEWQDTGPEIMDVIYAGLPHSSLTHVNNDEWGFIAKGKLSYDNRYDLYNNRHRMIVANGRVIPPNDFFTAESYEEINNGTLDTDKFPDGTPFAMVNLPRLHRREELEVFSLPDYTDNIIDNSIETLLSSLYPQATDNSPILIYSKYDLFSPFMNKIMSEIIATNIVINNTNLTDVQIDTLITPYKPLLEVDPTQMELNWGYIDIHPIRSITPINVTIEVFWFMQQINRLFLNNRVKYLNRYLLIN